MMRILAFGIHPDDIELGCGGTVALLAVERHEVVLVDLSDGASASNGTVETRAKEARTAAKILGAAKRINLGFADTALQSENLDQQRSVVACIRENRPDFVLLPLKDDPHPDHAAGGELVERALYLSGVHGYEAGGDAWRPKNALIYPGRRELAPDLIIDITRTHETKVRAIEAHDSQFGRGKNRLPTPLNSEDFLRSVEGRARLYGSRIGVRFGEPLRLLNPLAVTTMSQLLAGR
ncbi:MAG: bacillithiol biosynthesis deacetylase BshB1 [bacterium]|nr:bacillithiol biosynthesis deacetylase BshB1 [bacterium]